MSPLRFGKVESWIYAVACRDALGMGTPERVARMRAALGWVPVRLRCFGHILLVALIAGPIRRYDPTVSDALHSSMRNPGRLSNIALHGGDLEVPISSGRQMNV